MMRETPAGTSFGCPKGDHGGFTMVTRPAHRPRQGGKRVSIFTGGLQPMPCAGSLRLYLTRSSSRLEMQRHWTPSFSMSASNLVQQGQEDTDKQGPQETEQQGPTPVGGFTGKGHAGGFTHGLAKMPGGPSGGPH